MGFFVVMLTIFARPRGAARQRMRCGESTRRFKALAAEHSRLCETYVTPSGIARCFEAAKSIATHWGVCIF
jgi:hypothetical protein